MRTTASPTDADWRAAIDEFKRGLGDSLASLVRAESGPIPDPFRGFVADVLTGSAKRGNRRNSKLTAAQRGQIAGVANLHNVLYHLDTREEIASFYRMNDQELRTKEAADRAAFIEDMAKRFNLSADTVRKEFAKHSDRNFYTRLVRGK